MTFPLKRPAVFPAVVFLLTVAIARLNSYVVPRFHVTVAGTHVHHYVFGIFLLTAAGYLALTFSSRRARFLISLLYALGVGLTFDEFGLWVSPPFVRGARFNTNGLLIAAGAFVAIATMTAVVRYGTALLTSRKAPPIFAEEPTIN